MNAPVKRNRVARWFAAMNRLAQILFVGGIGTAGLGVVMTVVQR